MFHPGIAVLCADAGHEDVCVKLTVNQDAAGPCDDDLDSEAGSEVLDPALLEEMLARMEDDGDDARAAARHAPLAPKRSFSLMKIPESMPFPGPGCTRKCSEVVDAAQ